MTPPISDSAVEIEERIQAAIEEKIPDARVRVRGSGGHFEIDVEASAFDGKSTLERQRLVYRAIAPLMSGQNPPVHAVDKLTTSDRGPEAASADSEKLVEITEKAQAQVKRLIEAEGENDIGLRLSIRGGGCSGLTYGLEFNEKKEGDTIVEYDGFSVFLDRKSTIYLSGVTLDYQGGLSGRGFVFHNPHATSSCGCGESFSL
jgi:iron-sulfur cluster assembly protein